MHAIFAGDSVAELPTGQVALKRKGFRSKSGPKGVTHLVAGSSARAGGDACHFTPCATIQTRCAVPPQSQ